MRYLLLLKRLLKKKSYIAMLLVVPLMVLMLNVMSTADSGLMTIGVYIPGTDQYSRQLKQDLQENPGALQFVFYEDEDQMIADVKSQQVSEAWVIPENFVDTVLQMADRNKTKAPVEIVIREQGLTHMLGREVLCSRIYPMIAREIAIDYINKNAFEGEASEEQLEKIATIYDGYGINGNLFEMGYVDESATAESEDINYLMMPLRGILALWLLLCGIAASMYYLEDEKNGLFVWWKTKVPLVRDFLYYLVIVLIPSIMVLFGLAFAGVFTNPLREILGILLYDFVIIGLGNVLRLLIRDIKGLGIITPILIMASAIFSPVFIDLKEGRALQKFCPTFHYLYCIHDKYFVKSLMIYGIVLLIIWYCFNTLMKRIK